MTRLTEWWSGLSVADHAWLVLGVAVIVLSALVVIGLVIVAPLVDEDGTVPRDGYVRDLSGKERRVR